MPSLIYQFWLSPDILYYNNHLESSKRKKKKSLKLFLRDSDSEYLWQCQKFLENSPSDSYGEMSSSIIGSLHEGWLREQATCAVTWEPMFSKTLGVVSYSTTTVLKFLLLSLNLCFINKVPWGKEQAHEQRRQAIGVRPPILATLFAYSLFTVPRAQNSGGPTMHASSARLQASTR